MTDAPRDRKLARIARDLAWGNWGTTTKGERVMLLGPRGEVRDVFTQRDMTSLLAKRQALIDSSELSAAVYLGVLQIDDLINLSFVEFFDDQGDRAVHMLLIQPTAEHHWMSLSMDRFDQWFQHYDVEGGTSETPEGPDTTES